MRVCISPADPHRVGHRLIWPAEALVGDGHDVFVAYRTGREATTEAANQSDVIVIQRPMHRDYLELIENAHAARIAIAVDVDDDLSALSRRHPLWYQVHPHNNRDANWNILNECCRRADIVTVSTPALARRYGGHGRVVVVPNHVPDGFLDVVREPHDGVVVGWSGSVGTHPRDLRETGHGVARAMAGTDATFAVIGSIEGRDALLAPEHDVVLVERIPSVQEQLGLPEPPTSLGFLEMHHAYPVGMGQLDIGIVPLDRTQFNEAKSYLKGLEFAAAGTPFVATPTGPYQELAQHAGLLAAKPDQWRRHVRRLIESPDMRAELAGRGREWAATQTIARNCGMWLDAWSLAVENAARRRSRMPSLSPDDERALLALLTGIVPETPALQDAV